MLILDMENQGCLITIITNLTVILNILRSMLGLGMVFSTSNTYKNMYKISFNKQLGVSVEAS